MAYPSDTESDEQLFVHRKTALSTDRQTSIQAEANKEKWKRDFLRRLCEAESRFNDETLVQRTRSHCSDFKTLVTGNRAYAAEVAKLSLTAVQVLAVSSPAVTLQRDLPFFEAKYVNLFVTHNGIQGRTNEEIEKKLRSTRGSGGAFRDVYDVIKSGRPQPFFRRHLARPGLLTAAFSRSPATCECRQPRRRAGTRTDAVGASPQIHRRVTRRCNVSRP